MAEKARASTPPAPEAGVVLGGTEQNMCSRCSAHVQTLGSWRD